MHWHFQTGHIRLNHINMILIDLNNLTWIVQKMLVKQFFFQTDCLSRFCCSFWRTNSRVQQNWVGGDVYNTWFFYITTWRKNRKKCKINIFLYISSSLARRALSGPAPNMLIFFSKSFSQISIAFLNCFFFGFYPT